MVIVFERCERDRDGIIGSADQGRWIRSGCDTHPPESL